MYEECLTKLESNVYGLKYIPSIEPTYSNSADYVHFESPIISVGATNGNGQFSDNNYAKTLEEFLKIKDEVKCIFEIGVATNFEKSSTHLWLSYKNDDCHYFGTDINNATKMHHEEFKPNTHILGLNSRDDKQKILNKMKEYGFEQIDVLFIDGDHSIDLVLNDWSYAELVRPGGLILMHDSTIHPGPYLVFDAIDEKLFDKQKFFDNEGNDWGLAVIRKKC